MGLGVERQFLHFDATQQGTHSEGDFSSSWRAYLLDLTVGSELAGHAKLLFRCAVPLTFESATIFGQDTSVVMAGPLIGLGLAYAFTDQWHVEAVPEVGVYPASFNADEANVGWFGFRKEYGMKFGLAYSPDWIVGGESFVIFKTTTAWRRSTVDLTSSSDTVPDIHLETDGWSIGFEIGIRF
ncbi:MAG: hypothetical protein Q7T30_03165 [Planctomycetota bacterium]|nr:hypothetical protein [Planctomycetota bacterium]